MSIIGPSTYVDKTATPSHESDGLGGTNLVYPPLPGVYYITDRYTFSANAAVLSPYLSDLLPAQGLLAGDEDASNPVMTKTLHFVDQATADAIVGPINGAPPTPTPTYSNDGVPPPRIITVYDFLMRIPMDKRMAIRSAIPTNPIIADFMDLLNHVGGPEGPTVNLDDPNLQQGLGYLEQEGLLTSDDLAMILV